MKTEIAYCRHCGQEAGYWDDEKQTWFGEVVHRACQQKSDLKKLSILDKNSEGNVFDKANILSDIERGYVDEFKYYCKNFEGALEDGIGLLLVGNAGTGKTYYMNCITNELTGKGYKVLSFTISGYLDLIKSGYDKDSPVNNVEEKMMIAIDGVDLIAIDDVGSEKLSKEWGQERMFNLFNRISRKNKCLIMTSNMNGKQLKEHFMFNESDKIFDRMLQMCKGYNFTWGSRRKILGNEKFSKFFNKAAI